MQVLIKDFRNINKNDTVIAGGKGASLGEMVNAGIPVPPGFVILSTVFDKFNQHNKLDNQIDAILNKINHKDVQEAENASEKIKKLISDVEFPEVAAGEVLKYFKKLNTQFAAVRSSATAEDSASTAWAGQLESYLNTTEDNLLENIKKCWASLFTPRAIFYRFEKGLNKQKISVAVVVQKMIQSEVSGIAFSVHPVTEDYNQLIIEASYGLGEAIVSGQVTPDSYVVDKKERKVVEKMVQKKNRGIFKNEVKGNEWRDIDPSDNNKQALTDRQILELSDLIIKIEKHYGFPVDVEWALENGKFYIVQSRPITTLRSKTTSKASIQLEKFLTRDAPLIAMEHWWYRGCTEAFPEFFGFTFPPIFIFKNNGVFTSYWDTTMLDEYTKGYVDMFKKDSNRVSLIHDRLISGLNFFRKVLSLDKNTTISELVENLEITARYFQEGLPAVDAVHVLPVLHEQLQAERKSPFNETQIRKLISWREDAGNFFFNDGIDAFYFLLEQIGKKNGWQKELLKYITYTELTDALTKKKSLPINELRRRQESKFALIDGVMVFEPDIEKALRLHGYFLKPQDIPSVDEIKGVTAMPGKIRGICRVIFDRSQLNFAGEGEILVAPMTSPWYIPAMKRAGGIITDEGGITSHAAILSRELKKPCIIGTRIATQVLKDGDLVEVDADAGVVRILKKSGEKAGEPEKKTKPLEVKDYVKTDFGNWILTVTRNMPFWHNWLSINGNIFHTKNFNINAKIQELRITTNGTQTTVFLKKEDIPQYYNAIVEAIDSIEKVKKLKSYYQKYSNSLIQSLDILDHETNTKNWDNFIFNYSRFCAGLFITNTIGRAGMTPLTELLKKKGFGEKEIPEIISIITYPDEHTPLFKSQIDLFKIGEKIQNNQRGIDRIDLLKDWIKKHGYIPVNFCENPWSLNDAQKQLDEILKKECKNELKMLKQENKKRIEKKNEILADLNDVKITTLAYALAEGTYLNEFRKNIFSKISFGYRGTFLKIAKLGNSKNWRDCFYLTPTEMRSLIDGSKIDINKIIRERNIVGNYSDESGRINFIKEDDLKIFINYIDSLHGKNKSSACTSEKNIKGFAANRGIIKGKVKIILSAKDFAKIDHGDILVTTMTSVDFVPIMGIAGAFITNEGGITSHAAIVAREMNKPCIIGTKFATQVLKDGDLVEVDADAGVVRILN